MSIMCEVCHFHMTCANPVRTSTARAGEVGETVSLVDNAGWLTQSLFLGNSRQGSTRVCRLQMTHESDLHVGDASSE